MKKLLSIIYFLMLFAFITSSYIPAFSMEHEKENMSKTMQNQQQMMENQQEMMKMMKEMHNDMKEMHQNMEHMRNNHMDMMNKMDGNTQEKQTEHKDGK